MENKETKKLFFIAGERSGDLHGSNLIKSIKANHQEITCVGWGGEQMETSGMKLLQHYKGIAFMGFLEVIQNLGKIKQFLKKCKEQILIEKPDAIVLIDYGGFNMKIARFCTENNIKVHYYISPKVWAWNTKRAYNIKKYVNHLYCILPFEPKFFEQFDYKTEYVGNPVVDAVESFESNTERLEKPTIAVLPGSRKQEVVHMLHFMTDLVDDFPKYQFIVTAVDNLDDSLYDVAREKGINVVYNQTYQVLSQAEAAIVTSGTATLETALFEVPQVVCYKTSWLSYHIAKLVLKIPYISLVNLIADKLVVQELIQADYSLNRIKKELTTILKGENGRVEMKKKYKKIKKILGPSGASKKTADLIISRL